MSQACGRKTRRARSDRRAARDAVAGEGDGPQGAVGIERFPGMDLALAMLDPLEAGFDEIPRLQPLLGHAQDGLAGRQSVGRFLSGQRWIILCHNPHRWREKPDW